MMILPVQARNPSLIN